MLIHPIGDHCVAPVSQMDVGLAGIIQCNQEDGTCAAMRSELRMAPLVKPGDALHYKVALDTDGNAWSSRFRRLLSSGSVVFKSTIFPEFNTQWLKPWVHYVPVSIDLTSDLYQISTFFLGTPDGLEGHDDLAREIADAAARFTDEHWRWGGSSSPLLPLLQRLTRTPRPQSTCRPTVSTVASFSNRPTFPLTSTTSMPPPQCSGSCSNTGA